MGKAFYHVDAPQQKCPTLGNDACCNVTCANLGWINKYYCYCGIDGDKPEKNTLCRPPLNLHVHGFAWVEFSEPLVKLSNLPLPDGKTMKDV